MSVPLRLFLATFAIAFALFAMRGALACESAQPAPAAPIRCHRVVRMPSSDSAACASAAGGHCRSASCRASCCAGCSTHGGLLPVTFSFDAGHLRNAAPPVPRELLRAGIVRAPLLPPPIA